MKHIGLAGITVPGSLLCIESIVQASFDHFGVETGIHPQITYTNPPLSELPEFRSGNWDKVAQHILGSINNLANAGAEFAIIPANSAHYAISEVQAKSPIPVLNLVEITIKECQKRRFKKVGILGVGVTMSDGLYETPLKQAGLESATLDPSDQAAIDDLLCKEVIMGKPTDQTSDKMREFIQKLKNIGCDSFIAGCTEIPVIITSEADSPLPFVDTTRLLARKAFEEAIN